MSTLLKSILTAKTAFKYIHFPRYLSTAIPSSILNLDPKDNFQLFSKLSPLILTATTRHTQLISARDADQLNSETSAELRRLSNVADSTACLSELRNEFNDIASIRSDPQCDPEMLELADEETFTLRNRLSQQIVNIIVGLLSANRENTSTSHHSISYSNPSQSSSVILEIRAGTGGEEAALFVSDLLSMYQKLAFRLRWKIQPLSTSSTNLGGYREVIFRVSGTQVQPMLSTEAGVHRVQRVPTTETSGRLHTSTASIAVLNDNSSSGKAVQLKDSDIKIDVYRASGAGGQHVNTTESAVRATHLPTGIIATSQEERSQHRNRALALQVLAARVAAKQESDAIAARTSERRKQLGAVTGERSDRIRTYNFPQKRVTDHRIVPSNSLLSIAPSAKNVLGDKNAPLQAIMEGGPELEQLIESVHRAREFEFLEELLQRASEERSKESDELGDEVLSYMSG